MGTRHFSVAAEADLSVQVSGGGPRGLDPADFGGDDHSPRWRVPNHTYQTGVWLFIGAITMMFAGLTSTVVVRQSAAADWTQIYHPSILYANTLLLLLSSVSFEYARRAAKQQIGSVSRIAALSLYATMAMGLFFVVGQLIAWRMLVAHGVYLATNPSSSTFYLLTALHGLHLLGGIAVLAYLVLRMNRMNVSKFRACLGAASLYWHFMSALWIYILLLLVTRT